MKLRLALFAVALVAATAGVASADPIAFTNSPLAAGWTYVSSGQVNNYFSGVRDPSFSGGNGIELALRAQERFSASPLPFAVVNSLWGTLPMYTVPTGPSPAPNPGDYSKWNFDFSVAARGTSSPLSGASVDIDAVWGDVQNLNGFSLPGGSSPVQDSYNPGFGFLSGPGNFDYTKTGIYLFTLTATDADGRTVSTQMLVNVGGVAVPTPEPVSLVVFGGLIVGGAAAVWRRKKATTV